MVAGPVTLDNDVTWAARAERAAAAPDRLDDIAHLYLGEGLGCAVAADDELRRGHRGLAGEIAHVLARGPGGRAVPTLPVTTIGHAVSSRPCRKAIRRAISATGTARRSAAARQ